MIPRVIFISDAKIDATLDVSMITTAGIIINVWLEGHRRDRQRRETVIETLEKTRGELQQSVEALREREKAISTINDVCLVASESLDAQIILDTTVERIRDVMAIDVALAFLIDDNTGNLEIRAFRGVSPEFIDGIKGVKLGEGFNGRVAKTGEPMLVEDTKSDPRLTRDVVLKEGIISQLIVPLQNQDRIIGTLTVAGRSTRPFDQKDVDLLTTIGRQVGVSLENSRLYQQARTFASQQKDMQDTLRFYLHQVTLAQEEERRRIAQELHDDTIQELVLLLNRIDAFVTRETFLPIDQQAFLDKMRDQIITISSEVRRFTQDLRPSILDDLGLMPALDWLMAELNKNLNIKVDLQIEGKQRRFEQETELTLFRMVQEALRNIWKHSEATEARLTVAFEERSTVITIRDNGKGFNVPNKVEDLSTTGKLGMVGMQERAQLIGAELKVSSKQGKGTTVVIELPN